MKLFHKVARSFTSSLLTAAIIFLVALTGRAQELRFKRFTNADGLSQSNVLASLQDSEGYMWFCTRDGLNKYNGYSFEIFRTDASDPHSLPSNDIRHIIEDKDGALWIAAFGGLSRFNREQNNFTRYIANGDRNQLSGANVEWLLESRDGAIWVGTSYGLNRFDKTRNVFKQYFHEPNNSNSLSSSNITAIAEDQDGFLWIGTAVGLNKFNPETGEFFRYYHDPADPRSIGHDRIRKVFVDSKGAVWVGSLGGGLSLYDRQNDNFINYRHDPANASSLSHNVVLAINEDLNGNLWVGTENGGLNILDPQREKFRIYNYSEYDRNSISSPSIYSIYRDKRGGMWLGTFNGGVNFYDPAAKKFDLYRRNPDNSHSLNQNKIYAIDEDSRGNIWIATDGGGLNMMNPRDQKFVHFTHSSRKANAIAGNHILTAIVDRNDRVWAGAWEAGVSVYDIRTKSFTFYKHNPGDPGSLSLNNISNIYEDRSGGIWIATVGGGVNYLRNGSDSFVHYSSDARSRPQLPDHYPTTVYEDTKGNIWIGTEAAGITLLNDKKNRILHFAASDPQAFNGRKTFAFLEDAKGRLWICSDNGLNLFNYADSSFQAFLEEDGLSSNIVKSILEDDHGNLWLGTNKGLSKFNPETETFTNFGISDGLQDNEFNHNAALKASDGRMYFGGINGLNVFHPDSIKINDFIPPVAITDFRVFNTPVPIGKEGSPLTRHISKTEEIALAHDQSVISFEFAALNYTAPEKNQYAYMMEGFDKTWIYSGAKRTTTYTNLSPGEYRFRVIASNNDGVWNQQGAALRIVIVPPFWQTWWFRALIGFSLFAAGFAIYFIRVKTIQRQKEILESQVQERTMELARQAEDLKTANAAIKTHRQKLEALYTDMKDSIRAAQVIQNSILPDMDKIKSCLPESFILYKPRDVVSGDFYWFDAIDNQIIIAAVDCTGHGVSGAFMSINSHHLLNQAIYPHAGGLVASEVLDRLNALIIEELHSDKPGSMHEGMDIALCIIDKRTNKMQYAGANNPLYLVRNKKVIQIKANPFPIGWNGVTEYTNHEIPLQKDDAIYIFSDGYADQLGGPDGNEKFMYPRFRRTLVELQAEPLEEQVKILDEYIEKWRGDMEQLDDILVIGFKP